MILPGSYANGFAPRDGEPLYPELWRGCRRAWNMGLGPTGSVLRDQSPNRDNITLTSMTLASIWKPLGDRYTIDYAGTVEQPFSITDLKTPKFSVSIWLNPNGTQSTFAFPIGVSDGGLNGWHLWYDGSNWVLSYNRYDGIARLVVFGTLTSRVWTHLSGTFDGATLAAYKNGVLTQSKAISTAVSYTSTVGALWNRSGFSPFNGAIDDARIYDRGLNAMEAKTLALRRGIASELAPIRYAGETTASYCRRLQQAQIIGGGII